MIDVKLNLPGFANGGLSLERAPMFLRFVRGPRGFDALDQLDDEPQPWEAIVAAKRDSIGQVHVYGRHRCGRSFGRWLTVAEYTPCAEQPSEEIMRSTMKWRRWVELQIETGAQDE